MRTTFHNSTKSKNNTSLFLKKAQEYSKTVNKLLKKIDYSKHESSFFIAGDAGYHKVIADKLYKYRLVKHVVLVGIGGSSLGTEAVYNALKTKKSPSLTVIDSIENDHFVLFESLLRNTTDYKNIVIVLISKSGTTTETLLNASIVIDIFEKRYGANACSQIIAVSDEESPLTKISREKDILTFTLPNSICGRYSVFSAIGIVPLTLLKIDVSELLKGAMSVHVGSKASLIQKNAEIIAGHACGGIHTINFFTFNDRLQVVGNWYRQLLAESIGRDATCSGAQFTKQLLPTVTVSVDLHSVTELYLGGYKNIFTRFIYSRDGYQGTIPTKHWLTNLAPHLKKKRILDVKDAITNGVIKAYKDKKLPFSVTELPSVSAFEIGALMMSLMREVSTLAYILDIDPFIQPSVEVYKSHTKKYLSN